MGVICFVCGAMFGGLVGTVTMCLVQVRGNKKTHPAWNKSFEIIKTIRQNLCRRK